MTHNPMDCASRMNLAAILTPRQIAAEQLSLVQRPTLPPFLLQASLPDNVVKKFEDQVATPLSPRFTVFSLSCGALVGVATIQAAGLQLRTVVPLVDEKAMSWLDSCIERLELAWLLEVHERKQAALVRTACPFLDGPAFRSALKRTRRPQAQRFVLEVGEMCAMLRELPAIESCAPGTAVDDVYVLFVWHSLASASGQSALESALEIH